MSGGVAGARTGGPGQGLAALAAGATTAVVGFASSFVVVLAGLRGAGASDAQAASGLVVLCVTVGLTTGLLSWRYRVPLTTAWSTPGAAVLAGLAGSGLSFEAAVGGFLLTGALLVLTGWWSPLGRLASAIPTTIAQAMLAGVLFPLCLHAATGAASDPLDVLPLVALWLAGMRWWPRWCLPVVVLGALAVVGVRIAMGAGSAPGAAPSTSWWPELVPVLPAADPAALLAVVVPLYVVTMASQNVPGVAVMKGLGFEVPWRGSLTATGLGTVAGAFGGGHAINLAAISAALAASDETGVERSRRWRVGLFAGGSYLLLAAGTPAVVAIALVAPPAVFPAMAGLALMGTLVASLRGAFAAGATPPMAEAATFLVAASGVVVAGVSSAFWALVCGLAISLVLRRSAPGRPSDDGGDQGPR